MGNTLLTFQDQYYEHGGSLDPSKRGLTIGGYESAWLADLVAAWIFKETEKLFRQTSKYHGIYRDDGIVIFQDKWTIKNIYDWFYKDLQFTMSIWSPEEKKVYKYNKVIEIYGKNSFPFLDLQLFWNTNNELKFKVYMKENQQLKYLNYDSTHTKCCMRAIPYGLFKRLAKLTSINKRNINKKINELYPNHTKALKVAGLTPKKNFQV